MGLAKLAHSFVVVLLISLIGIASRAESSEPSETSPSDLLDFTRMEGVRYEVMPLENGLEIYHKPPESSVLMTPMATRSLGNGTVQIWYLRVDYASTTEYQDQLALCLGEIRNHQWLIPAIHVDPPAWGGLNNVVMRRSPDRPTWGGFNPFQILFDTDVLRMLYWDQPGPSGKAGGLLATSQDGQFWQKSHTTVFTEFNDSFTIMRVKDEYRLYQTALQTWPDKPVKDNLPEHKRVILLRTSRDHMKTWTPQEISSPVLAPDEHDPPGCEFYCFKAFPYGNSYAGIIWKYEADPGRPREHSRLFSYELAVSRDGLIWERPFRKTNLQIFPFADPFHETGRTWLVTPDSPDSPTSGSVRLRGWERGRLYALTGHGSFMTNTFLFPVDGLNLNADISVGTLDVGVCDADGVPLAGYHPVQLKGVNGHSIPLNVPPTLQSQRVSLRFTMKDGARLFGISSRERLGE